MTPSLRLQLSRMLGLTVLALLLSGCVAPLMVGGFVGGTMVASDRRTAGAQLEDQGIEIRASAWRACSRRRNSETIWLMASHLVDLDIRSTTLSASANSGSPVALRTVSLPNPSLRAKTSRCHSPS